MAPTTRLAYAEAYPIKEELGGGYRGAARNMLTGETKRGEQRETLEMARYDAKRFVQEFAAGRNLATGTYKSRKGLWRCNFFIRTDEVERSPDART